MTLHTPPPGLRTGVDEPPQPGRSHEVRATYEAFATKTSPGRVFETGGLRLRHPRGRDCEAILVNTGGGIVAGDRLAVSLNLAPGARMTLTSAAAEKVYRADLRHATIATKIVLQAGSALRWLPQETILFDGARLRRSITIDVAPDATFLATEILVFGRIAHGETAMQGSLRDSWRLRRDDHLVFADETRLEGALGPTLARAAMARGARAMGLMIYAAPDAAASLDTLREALEAASAGTLIEAGATCKDGIIIARFLAASGEPLRGLVETLVKTLGGGNMPRSWT